MNSERLMMVLKEPYTSEKSTNLLENNQYAFKVLTTATKVEIKQAVEMMFNVKVKDVSLMNVKGKAKRFRQIQGKRSDWKKAYVTLQPDQKIDLTQAQ